MNNVIDTLHFSGRLQQGGFTVEQANTLARALSDELAGQLITKSDLKMAIDTLSTKFEARFNAQDARLDSQEARFDALDAKLDSLEVKLNFLFALIGLLVILGLIPVLGPLLG